MALICAALFLGLFAAACHVITKGEEPNLIPNPGFVSDSDKDGVPDGWEMGSSKVKDIALSKFSVVEPKGYKHRFLKVVGGEDLAGFWWCRVKGIEPYRDYALEFDVIKGPSRSRGYPRVELFGHAYTLDQIGLVGRAQHVKLNFNSEKNRGETIFRFVNNTSRAYHLGRPVLRPMKPKEYRLKLDPRPVRYYKKKRLAYFPVGALGGWKSSFEELGDAGFNCAVVPPDTGVIQRAHQVGLNAAIRLPRGAGLDKFLKSLKRGSALMHKGDFFILDLRPEMRGVTPEELAGVRSSLTGLLPKSFTLTSLLRPRFAEDFRDSSDAFVVEGEDGDAPASLLADKVELASILVSEDRVYALVDLTSSPVEKARGSAFLALAHGASGIFFRMEEGKSPSPEIKGLVFRIEDLKEWLSLPSQSSERPLVTITSRFLTDARGWPAVHTCLKREGDRWLIIAANGVNRPTRALLEGLPEGLEYLRDVETGATVALRDGKAMLSLGPYDARFLTGPARAEEQPGS